MTITLRKIAIQPHIKKPVFDYDANGIAYCSSNCKYRVNGVWEPSDFPQLQRWALTNIYVGDLWWVPSWFPRVFTPRKPRWQKEPLTQEQYEEMLHSYFKRIAKRIEDGAAITLWYYTLEEYKAAVDFVSTLSEYLPF